MGRLLVTSFTFLIHFYDSVSYLFVLKRCELYGFSAIQNIHYCIIFVVEMLKRMTMFTRPLFVLMCRPSSSACQVFLIVTGSHTCVLNVSHVCVVFLRTISTLVVCFIVIYGSETTI